VAAESWIKTLKQTIQYKKTHNWPILIIVKSIHYERFFKSISSNSENEREMAAQGLII